MKVWVIDDYNNGITHVFDSETKAKNHLMDLLIKNCEVIVERYDNINDIKLEYKALVNDIKTLNESLYVEDLAYVYTYDVE